MGLVSAQAGAQLASRTTMRLHSRLSGLGLGLGRNGLGRVEGGGSALVGDGALSCSPHGVVTACWRLAALVMPTCASRTATTRSWRTSIEGSRWRGRGEMGLHCGRAGRGPLLLLLGCCGDGGVGLLSGVMAGGNGRTAEALGQLRDELHCLRRRLWSGRHERRSDSLPVRRCGRSHHFEERGRRRSGRLEEGGRRHGLHTFAASRRRRRSGTQRLDDCVDGGGGDGPRIDARRRWLGRKRCRGRGGARPLPSLAGGLRRCWLGWSRHCRRGSRRRLGR